ncbi:papilin-like isoform X3 [Apostichopus japonicus]|uniref:papilin-like isoform X3 n=1 Tax=Stichopus japonicus TaxID=307972 RepID=UPI003AB2F85A
MRLLAIPLVPILLLHCVLIFTAADTEEGDRQRKGGPVWGPWSEWSACSRTCGGGVYYQERQCFSVRDVALKADRCDGSSRVYQSCNIQDCPEGSKDFREEQCSSFNEVPFDGNLYTWVPYLGGPSQHCQLNCMPKGENFYYTQAEMVVDGTLCGPDSLDICVAGECKKVGCDMMLNSTVVLDKCGECDGDNSSCKRISGEFLTKQLQSGKYNDVVTLPVGATSIFIEEKQSSSNFLALRSVQGEYFINGGYIVSSPQAVKVAGTTFHYERHGRDSQGTIEVFQSAGPLTEAVMVMLLTQGSNTGVSYEYWVPNGFTQADTFVWSVGSYQECSVDCGGGVKHREVYCSRRVNSEVVADYYCDKKEKPVSNTSCNIDLCPPKWHIGDWSECPMTCAGDGVMQQRHVICMRPTGNNGREEADPQECIRVAGPEPDHFQLCNEDVQCPQWYTEDWSQCSEPCGPGVQTREVSCGHFNDVGILDCDEAEKPPTEQACVEKPCSDLKWMAASDWTKCTGSCGETMQSREIVCTDTAGAVYPEETCVDITKPDIMQHCDKKKDKCKPKWVSTDWTECSASCGKGVMSRFVFCASHKRDRWVEVPERRCKEQKPETMQSCGNGPCETGTWMTGDWSECSVTCGAGKENRNVMCFLNGYHGDEELCKQSSRPSHVRRCVTDVICPDHGVQTTPSTTTEEPTDAPLTSERKPDHSYNSSVGDVSIKIIKLWYAVGDFCSLEPNTGPCRNFEVYWYYDEQYSQCARFWYGGCEGNDNRFTTQKSCEASCIEDHEKLTQEELCSLPKDSGPCAGNYHSYFYDTDTQSCQAFIYGGCQGNQNRFIGQNECESICGTFRKDPCTLPSDAGRCQEAFGMWYYELYSDTCLPFVYSGCFGNPNRFTDKSQCEDRCVQHSHAATVLVPEGAINICALPAESGDCRDRQIKWYYNQGTRLCDVFTYSGCNGNENNFDTQDKCVQTCSSGIHTVYLTTVRPTTSKTSPEITFTPPPTKQPTPRAETTASQVVLNTSPFSTLRPRTKCENERTESSILGQIGQFIPRCTEEGLYQRLQCHASIGQCFCVNETTGSRFEESLTNFAQPDCDEFFANYKDKKTTLSPVTTSVPTTTSATSARLPESQITTLARSPEFITLDKPLNNATKLQRGDEVGLRCHVSGTPPLDYLWYKNNEVIDVSLDSHMRIKQFGWGSRLTIDGVDTTDNGNYMCHARNNAGEVFTTGIVTVRLPETIPPSVHVDAANVSVLTVGDTYRVICEASGVPEPTVLWIKDGADVNTLGGKRISNRAGKLKIKDVVTSDSGEYVCRADDGQGNIVEKVLVLQVQDVADRFVPGRETRVTARLGNDVEMGCESADIISISWQHSSVELGRPEGRLSQSEDNALRIRSVQLTDAGSYACTGRIGTRVVLKKYYKLVVEADAEIVLPPEDKQAAEGDLVEFFCDSIGSPAPVTEWYLNDILVVESSRVSIGPLGSLTINGIKTTDSGDYTCIVSNRISSQRATAALTVIGNSETDPNCVDSPTIACQLIVLGALCDTPYGEYCCRSCRDNGY